jgi:hypothetical protein
VTEWEPSARGYRWATLFVGDINTGTRPYRSGSLESETVKCGHVFFGTWTRRVTLKCASKLQTPPLVREGATQHEDRKCPTAIKIWLWSLRPDTRTNWSIDRRSHYNLYLSRSQSGSYWTTLQKVGRGSSRRI